MKEIDWEERRYEIAKECFSGNLSHFINIYSGCDKAVIARVAVSYADALIEKLKK